MAHQRQKGHRGQCARWRSRWIGRRRLCHIDAQDRAQHVAGVLGVVLRVVVEITVAHRDIEVAVRPERQLPAAVDDSRFGHTQHFLMAGRVGQIRVVRRHEIARHHHLRCRAIQIVYVEAAIAGVVGRKRQPKQPPSLPLVVDVGKQARRRVAAAQEPDPPVGGRDEQASAAIGRVSDGRRVVDALRHQCQAELRPVGRAGSAAGNAPARQQQQDQRASRSGQCQRAQQPGSRRTWIHDRRSPMKRAISPAASRWPAGFQ